VVQFTPSTRDEAVRLARSFAQRHVVNLWYSKDGNQRLLEAYANNSGRGNRQIRVLFEMTDFHSWDMAALWDDIKFDVKHFSDSDCLAMVGDKGWEGMAGFCRPFTTATDSVLRSRPNRGRTTMAQMPPDQRVRYVWQLNQSESE
jgi:hypothetical protein